jgi:hypothetical protein
MMKSLCRAGEIGLFEQRLFMESFHKRGAKFRTHYSALMGLIIGRIIDSVNGWQNVVGELGQKAIGLCRALFRV